MSSDPLGLDLSPPAADAIAIRVRDVSKHYVMFQQPQDRFKQMVVPRLQRLAGRPPKRYFTDFAALSGVSFDVRRGETVGIIGRNGSGKSTLLQIVCGTLRPTTGSVEVNGRIAALLELGAGFNPEFTGRENVFLNAAILGVPQREMEWRFDDIARFADIGAFIDQPVKTYSSGMYVRLAFATAINVDPDILVVDEALSVGDEAFQRKCFARIEEIKDKGGTILFVSHGAQTIVQLCSRAMLFDRGELLLQGRPKSVVAQYQRLVNASPEMVDEIRLALTGSSIEALTTQAPLAEEVVELPAPEEEGRQDEEDRQEAEATPGSSWSRFDSALVSETRMVGEERGARIENVRITTQAGEVINLLQMGKRYCAQFDVTFDTDAEAVGFAVRFRTIQGLVLGGADTRKSAIDRIRKVRSGERIAVTMEFACRLLPGVYFINCNTSGMVDGEHLILHRIVDATALRVEAEPRLIAVGRADLDIMVRTSSRSSAI
ncbi:MAG: ABC transporter ATP-binding protein [Rhizobiaceae bacterium]|nr:ABC transporter ATP-binding protein [Rhizobiaceae bacterium]